MTLDSDLAAAMRVLRYWFGRVEVLGVEQGSGDAIPGLASQQLSLTIEAQTAPVGPPVKVEHPTAERP